MRWDEEWWCGGVGGVVVCVGYYLFMTTSIFIYDDINSVTYI
jgi:hypothetical protein